MAGGIEVDTKWVTCHLAGLDLVSGGPEREHLRLDGFYVVDREIEVQLLRPLSRRPGRWHEVGRLLERHASALDDQRHPVALVDRDLSAEQTLIELCERTRLGAVEDDRTKASERSGHRISLAPSL